MLNFRFEKSNGLGLLTFDGELTTECADRVKEALMIALENAEHIVVNLDKLTKIDPICIHLLCMAYRKSKRLKKWLSLICTHPETHKKLEKFENSIGSIFIIDLSKFNQNLMSG